MAPESSSPASPQRALERALFDRLARERTPAARDAIVAQFMPLARQLARRYSHGRDVEDMEQVAALGLVKAIDRYDPQRGIAFSSFAFPTIAGEIKRYLRDHAWSVRVPRDLQETYLRLDRSIEALTGALGRAPTAAELAAELDTTVEAVLEARQAASARYAASLDQPIQEDDETAGTVGAHIGVHESGFDRAEASAVLDSLLDQLSERERLVLRLRFERDLTQNEIAKQVGISQMHVSRVLRGAIARLQQAAAEE